MTEKIRKMALSLTAILLSGSLLTACSGISVSGGVIGSVLSIIGITVLLLSFGTTQSACEVKPCLSIIVEQPEGDGGGSKDTPPPDRRVEPDRSEPDLQPCLSPPPPDRRVEPDRGEPDLQPCLSPPPPDRRVEPDRGEPDLQPCLSPPPPDQRDEPVSPDRDAGVGPCLSQPPPDQGSNEGGKDTRVGPCLSPPPPDKMGMNSTDVAPSGAPATKQSRVASRAVERNDAIARLQQRGILPPDVAARLEATKSNKKG